MWGTLLELFWSCIKIGLLAFGGGNAAIPLLEAAAVPRWMSQQEFGELVSINFAFPGISILKLADMVGLHAAGAPGLLVVVIGLASPGLVLTIATYGLVQYRDHGLGRRSLMAMQYAAAALLASSAVRMVQSASGGQFQVVGLALVLGRFLVAYVMQLGPVLVLVLAAALGLLIL